MCLHLCFTVGKATPWQPRCQSLPASPKAGALGGASLSDSAPKFAHLVPTVATHFQAYGAGTCVQLFSVVNSSSPRSVQLNCPVLLFQKGSYHW